MEIVGRKLLFWGALAACLARPCAVAAKFYVNPMIAQASVPPGESFDFYYTLESEEGGTYTLTLEQEWPKPEKGKNSYPVGEWMRVKQETITVAPKGSTPIACGVVTKKSDRGEVAGRIIVKDKKEIGRGMMLGVGVSPVLYISFEGTEDIKGGVRDWNWKYDAGREAVVFSWRLENQGNVHLRPRGEIIFHRDARDQDPASVLAVPMSAITWPQSKNAYSYTAAMVDLPSADREYEVELKLYAGELFKQPGRVLSQSRRGRLKL